MRTFHLSLAVLLASTSALAAPSRPPPCQGQAVYRSIWPQGTSLWGTSRQVLEEEMSSVLSSVDLARIHVAGTSFHDVRLEDGRLLVSSRPSGALAGALLQGTASNGQPVEVALCGVEAGDDALLWYRIEVWNTASDAWENPCVATSTTASPRALAIPGVWDARGVRHDVPGKFTFACQDGAIAKCATWGYKPWGQKDGHSLAQLHQACTRMARADYCGDGRSHTHQDTLVDVYDGLGLLSPTTEDAAQFQPEQGSFEAAWTPEGASCLARTRDGRPVQSILAECPDRFEAAAVDLDHGDTCAWRRKGEDAATALLRNRSFGQDRTVVLRRK